MLIYLWVSSVYLVQEESMFSIVFSQVFYIKELENEASELKNILFLKDFIRKKLITSNGTWQTFLEQLRRLVVYDTL